MSSWRRSAGETGSTTPGPRELPLVLPDGQPKLLLTPEEAARALGIGRTKLYELLASAKLPSVRIGGSRRVSVDALTEFVRRLTPSPGSARVR